MVCLRNISVDTLHKGDTEDNNNNKCIIINVELKTEMIPEIIGATGTISVI